MKGFIYKITVTALLSKAKINGSIKYSPVYFNSTTKKVINSEFILNKSFQLNQFLFLLITYYLVVHTLNYPMS